MRTPKRLPECLVRVSDGERYILDHSTNMYFNAKSEMLPPFEYSYECLMQHYKGKFKVASEIECIKCIYILTKDDEWGDIHDIEEYFLSLEGAIKKLNEYLRSETQMYTEVPQHVGRDCKRHFTLKNKSGDSDYYIYEKEINP